MHKCSNGVWLYFFSSFFYLFNGSSLMVVLWRRCSLASWNISGFFYFVTIFPHIKVDDWVSMVCRLDRKLFATIIDFWWRNFRIVGSICDISYLFFSLSVCFAWCCARGRFYFYFIIFFSTSFSHPFANILFFFHVCFSY